MTDHLNRHLRDLEEQLLNPSTRSSRSELQKLLSPEFREIGRSGQIYSYQQTIDALLNQTASENVIASHFEILQLSETLALVTYRTQRAEAIDQRHTLRSSLWRLEDEDWRMVFHQGTPAVSGKPI